MSQQEDKYFSDAKKRKKRQKCREVNRILKIDFCLVFAELKQAGVLFFTWGITNKNCAKRIRI